MQPEAPNLDGRVEPSVEDSFAQCWQVGPQYAAYFHRFVGLAASRGIRVFLLVSPFAPEGRARGDGLGHDAHHMKNLRALQSRRRNLVILDARHAGYSRTRWVDSVHLSARGARALSEQVAPAIAGQHRGEPLAPRWVELPRLDGLPDEPGGPTRLAAHPARTVR